MVVRCREHMCWLFLRRTCTPTTSISFGRTCVSASSSRSLQSVLVLLVAQRYRKFDVWSLYGLTTWQRNEILTIWESFPIISRSHPSCHDRSEWRDPALKRTRSQGATWKMSCVHFATRVVQKTQLTEQAKFKSSKWHSTAPNKKATSPDIEQRSHEIRRTVELRQNCIWSSITVEHGAWQERMICAWDMWKRGAIFMAFRQAAQLKPLANRILRNFHHVPNSLSEYAGRSNFEPGLFWCILHCPAVFSCVHLFQKFKGCRPCRRPRKKKRGSQCNPQSSQVRWMDVCPRLLDLCFCCSPSLLSVRIETLHLRPVRCSFISSTNWARVHPVWFPRYKTIAVLSCWYYL